MAQSITVQFKDERKPKTFTHQPRAGGSWSLTCRYVDSFFVVKDEWGNETAYPAADILEVNVQAERNF